MDYVSIEDLDLSVRSYNCLRRAGINSLEDIIEKTEEEMLHIRNLGRKNLEEIKSKLEEYGFSFKDDLQENPMTKVEKLRNALECLKDEYVQYVDNACHCNEYDDNEECSYCYAKRVLEETK